MLVKFAVIGGNASRDLGKRIARRLKAPYVEAKTRVFPDGESKITFGKGILKDLCNNTLHGLCETR